MGSYMTKRRGALIGVSTGGGGRRSAWTQHETQHGPPQAGSRTGGCTEPAARCPLAVTEKHTALHYWLFYTSRKGGLYATVRTGVGFSPAPRDESGPEGQKVYAQGGTGGL